MTFARGLTFVLVTYAATLLTAALASVLHWPVPDLALLSVLYLGLRGPASLEGALLGHLGVAMIVGYLTDLVSGAPRGLESLTFFGIMLAARLASRGLMFSARWQKALLALAASLTNGVLCVALTAGAVEGAASFWQRLVALPVSALVTALAAPLWFAVAARVDERFLPAPRGLSLAR